MIAANDIDLAKQLGTNRKGIGRWRTQFPEHPGSRDVGAWRQFMEDNQLGPYSPQRHYGEALEAGAPALLIPVSKRTPGKGECLPPCAAKYLTGEALAAALPLDMLFDSYLDGKIDAAQLRILAPATLASVLMRARTDGMPAQLAPYFAAWKTEIVNWIGGDVFAALR